MDPGQILRDYNGAENKKKQVGVLAELNACTKEEIIGILKEQGVPEDELVGKKGRKAGTTRAKEGSDRESATGKDVGRESPKKDVPDKEEAGDGKPEKCGEKEDAQGDCGQEAMLVCGTVSVSMPAQPMPKPVLEYLNVQKIALTERIEQDTEKLDAINKLMRAYFK